MMNDFTPRAQQVLALARQEAERFNHHYVGTEHLLLGLIKLGQGVAVNVLQRMGLDLSRFERSTPPNRVFHLLGSNRRRKNVSGTFLGGVHVW
jgi:ATP-dependent Clp protease ATP-binding subunit ClpA